MKSNTPYIVIVGQGKLAQAIEKQCRKEKVACSFWNGEVPTKKSVVLYCGSSRLIKEVITFCIETNSQLLMFSTDVNVSKIKDLNVTSYVNTSSEVSAFVATVTDFAKKVLYKKVSIFESHQKAKKDVSGTARHLARALGKSNRIITSIRDEQTQSALGVPKEHFESHAYHKVTFLHDGLVTEFTILVLGREPYARGALKIVRETK
jgi:dihydrodipicolinate reductase